MEGMKPVYRTCPWGCGLLNLQSVGDLQLPKEPPRLVLDKGSLIPYLWGTYYEAGPVSGAGITVVTKIDRVPALRQLTTSEGSISTKE